MGDPLKTIYALAWRRGQSVYTSPREKPDNNNSTSAQAQDLQPKMGYKNLSDKVFQWRRDETMLCM